MIVVDQAEQLRKLVQHAQDESRASQTAVMPPLPPVTLNRSHPKKRHRLEPSAPPLSSKSEYTEVTDETPQETAQIIAIASGKGGVGKSNVAVNLSVALSQMGKKVTLVDADMGLANADLLCGVKTPATLAHVLMSGRRSLQDIIIPTPAGFDLVPGASGVREMADLAEDEQARLINELSVLEQTADVILFDTSAGINKTVISIAALADTLLVVITPEPTSIADGYGLIKAVASQSRTNNSPTTRTEEHCSHPLKHVNEGISRIAVLINMADSAEEARRVFDRISMVSKRFLDCEVQYAGYLPIDRHVRESVIARQPFTIRHPDSAASKAIFRLGHTIELGSLPTSSESHALSVRGNYFKKLLQWLRPI